MAKLSKLSLLLVPLMLVSCSPTSTPSEPSIEPSTEPTVEPSTSEDPTSSNAEFEKQVKNTIGSKTKLSNHIKSFAETSIVTMNYYSSNESSYSSSESTTSVMHKSKEVYATVNSTETTTTTSKSSFETIYSGIVDGIYYNANISDSVLSNVRRYKISETSQPYELDKITLENAESSLASNKTLYNLSIISEYGFWSDILSASARERSYSYTIYDDYIRVVLEAYTEGYNCTDYQFIVSFDLDLKLTSGVLNTTKYEEKNWDKTTHKPVADAAHTVKTKVSLDGVEYGEPLETKDSTIIPLDDYFTQSLNPSLIEITNSVNNPVTGMSIYSEPNTIYPRQPLDCPVDLIKENKAYSPATALDTASLYITGTSKEGFITCDQYGWTVTGAIGDKAMLYIGNSFNEKLCEIEVEIVQSPVKNNAIISPSLIFVTDSTSGNYTFNPNGERPTLVMNSKNTIVVAIATYNDGPFDDIPVAFSMKNKIVTAQLVEDQTQYYETVSYRAIYFTITALTAGETVFAIVDKNTGEGFFEVALKVNI